MPERLRADDSSDDDARARLSALTTLMFTTPPNHPASEKAQRLNAHLAPVRECAREALRAEPREGPPTAQAHDALERAWGLVDEAGGEIDRAGWWLHQGDSTRAWAERHVERPLAAWRRRTPIGSR